MLRLDLSVLSTFIGEALFLICGLCQSSLFTLLCLCSVTTQEVVDAIEKQTGRKLDKRLMNLPEIKQLGTYPASVKLHPEVLGEFKVVVVREKMGSGGKKEN